MFVVRIRIDFAGRQPNFSSIYFKEMKKLRASSVLPPRENGTMHFLPVSKAIMLTSTIAGRYGGRSAHLLSFHYESWLPTSYVKPCLRNSTRIYSGRRKQSIATSLNYPPASSLMPNGCTVLFSISATTMDFVQIWMKGSLSCPRKNR